MALKFIIKTPLSNLLAEWGFGFLVFIFKAELIRMQNTI